MTEYLSEQFVRFRHFHNREQLEGLVDDMVNKRYDKVFLVDDIEVKCHIIHCFESMKNNSVICKSKNYFYFEKK